MKPLNLILAALCVTGGLSDSLVDPFPLYGKVILPRVKGNDVYTPRKASSRGGYKGDNAQPEGRPKHIAADVEYAKRVASERDTVKIPRVNEMWRDSTPPHGQTAITYSSRDNIGTLYAGERLKKVSNQVQVREEYDPSERGYPYQPRPRNDEEHRAGREQRNRLIGTLPSGQGLVRDHKPPSSHYEKPGSIWTVGYDNARSQSLEGSILKAVNKPVIDHGYSDPKDGSTWKGKGGVRIIPNADRDPHYRPEIGPPGSTPRKYTVRKDDEDERQRRKRNTPPSRSSSDDSRYAIVTKTRRSGRHDPERRDIAGVGDIANTEATAASSGSQTHNGTSQAPELQVYLDAWEIIYQNATDILWPYIVDMLAGSNSSRVITAAWSVYAHMIPTPYVVTGPFYHGWTSLYSQEAAWATEANMTNATLTELFAIDDVLISLYTAAWDGGYKALNSSGVLDDLDWLTDVIILAYNASLPITMPDPNNDPYADFFLSYDSIVPDSELDLNGTGIECPATSGTAAFGAVGTGDSYFNGALCTATAVPSGVIYPRRGLAGRM